VWSDGRTGGKRMREGFEQKYWHSNIEFWPEAVTTIFRVSARAIVGWHWSTARLEANLNSSSPLGHLP
jgi:hypothetical protein